MLSHKLLKNHAGILLCGDYMTLEALHQVVHEVNDQSVLIEDKEGMFLGLAYDVRKAFERQRTVIKPEKHFPEMGVRYGVEILWPVLLLQCRLLRCSLAYFDSSKRQQAITYALEDVIETAINEAFGAEAASIAPEWRRMDASQPVLFVVWRRAQTETGWPADKF
jgi:hypothetical protein